MLAEKLEFETTVEFPYQTGHRKAPRPACCSGRCSRCSRAANGQSSSWATTASPGLGEDSLLGTFDLPTRYTAPNVPANLLLFLARNALLKPEENWDRDDFEEALSKNLNAVSATGMMGINQRPLVGMLHEHQVPLTEISRTVFRPGRSQIAPFRGSMTSSTETVVDLVGNNLHVTLLRSAFPV